MIFGPAAGRAPDDGAEAGPFGFEVKIGLSKGLGDCLISSRLWRTWADFDGGSSEYDRELVSLPIWPSAEGEKTPGIWRHKALERGQRCIINGLQSCGVQTGYDFTPNVVPGRFADFIARRHYISFALHQRPTHGGPLDAHMGA